ncbi:hypothetical protein B0H10DRAFT_2227105 [Mycena sp. CBHHK59/15]|nr:hypothetical protein B0H10DRAFT_2227105 [Mycena sp. CBHHK59/15]
MLNPITEFKMFLTTKMAVFLATVVVAVSAQSGVFSSAVNCTGTQLQTVEFTNGLCVPSNGAVSAQFIAINTSHTVTQVTFYTNLAHQNLSFQVVLGSSESECVNIPGNIQSVGMFW